MRLAVRCRRTVAAASLGAVLALIAANCGEERRSAADPASAGVTMADLDGRAFVTTGDRSLDSPDHRLVQGTTLRLEFHGSEVRATAGCNTLFGDAAVADGRLTVSSLGGTELGCPPGPAEQDRWLTTFLASGPEVSLDGAVLTLVAEGSTLRLTDEADVLAEPPLEGTDWRLEAITRESGDTASATSGPGFAEAGIRIAGGQVEVETGCGSARAPVEVVDDTIRVAGELPADLGSCRGQDRDVAHTMLDVLGAAPTYQLGTGVLTLTAPDGQGLQLSAR